MSGLPRWKLEGFGLAIGAIFGIACSVATLPCLADGPWWVRGAVSAGAVAIAAGAWFVLMSGRCRTDHAARRYIDLLCRIDHHELNSPGVSDSLPVIAPDDPWRPVFARIRDCLADHGRRIQEFERSQASTGVRNRKLSHEHQRATGILDGLSLAVLAVDGAGELVFANAAAGGLLRIADRTKDRASLEARLPCPPLVELLRDMNRRKTVSQRILELEVADESGNTRSYRAVCRGSMTGEGDTREHGTVAVLTDITDQKGAQKRNAEFVSAVSHEMKTPLAGIKAYVELLADGSAEDEATKEEFLEVINGQVDRLERLIDNLLNLARMEAGVVDVHKQPLSLNQLLGETLSVLQPAAERKRIRLTAELSPLFLSVLADRDMLSQAAINLLSNAVKYTREDGAVVLRSRVGDGCTTFEVADTGVGLSPEDARRVFEKFYRVKKDRNMAPGTGLGLPLAKHIVEDVHGGSLIVQSELGKGSTFIVSLPTLQGAKDPA